MSDKLFHCPYNPAHVMKYTRAHHHMVDCRKANAHMDFIICSYNALHHYPREAESQHLASCPDRIALINSRCAAYGNETVTGNLTMPPPVQIEFDKEDWESD